MENLRLTSDVEVCLDLRRSMAVLSDASVLSGFVSTYSFVEEKQIIRKYSVSLELPKVVGLRIRLCGAQNFLWGFTLFNHNNILWDLNIFRGIWNKDKYVTVQGLFSVLSLSYDLHSHSRYFVMKVWQYQLVALPEKNILRSTCQTSISFVFLVIFFLSTKQKILSKTCRLNLILEKCIKGFCPVWGPWQAL